LSKKEKKEKEQPQGELLDDLMKGTKFSRVSEAEVMHRRGKVRTPIIPYNALMGGGFPLGAMVEIYGEPSAGKSSFSYQVMGEFQKQYDRGVSVIVDVESSVDEQRMRYLGCDPDNILRLPAGTMESGFEQVHKLLKRKLENENARELPVLILWDTISISPTDSQFEESDGLAGAMMKKAKLIKNNLSNMLPLIEDQPVLFLFLNQVTTKKGRYSSTLTSGGGYGLKHDIHQKLKFNRGDEEYDGEFAISAVNTLDIDKSKLSPLYGNIEFKIDIKKGGVIDELESVIEYCFNSNREILHTASGWYGFSEDFSIDYEETFGKDVYDKYIFFTNKRRDKFLDILREDREIYKRIFAVLIMKRFSDVYEYQSQIIEPYKNKVIAEIKDLAKSNLDIEEGVGEEDGSQ